MKNLKLATKISLIVAVILVIGLSFLCLAMNRGISTLMRNAELDNMNTMLDAREEILNQYVASAEAYLIGFGQAPQLKEALFKPNDAGIIGDAQAYTEGYAAVNSQLENIYLADYDTTVLTSFVTGAIGKTLREGDSREQLRKDIYSGTSVFNAGIMTSKSTGMQVISMNCPIYDGDKPLGYVGGAIYAEGLRNVLKELDAKSGGSNEFLLLDAASGAYIFCDTDELIGTPIEDENVLNIIQQAMNSAEGSGNVEYHQDGKTMLAVYKYMPDRNWVVVTVADSDIAFADIRTMTSQLVIMCLVIGIIIAVAAWLSMKYVAKDISKIAGAIGEIATLDLTLKSKLESFVGRKDEVGAIAVATQTLTDAVSNTVKTIQDESRKLADVSTTLVEDVTSSTESIDNMEDAIHEIAESATQQAADTQKAANNVVGIGNKIETTMQETDRLHEYADTIQKTGQELLNTVKALAQANDSTKQAIEDIGVQTVSTNESAIKIKDAAQLITSIAEETNLLSLNASIEAARAGEQGRGFAVVASQIQKLAEQSNDSARFIDNIINTLLTDSEKAVESMNEMRSVVMEQVKQLEYTEVQFEQMYQNIGITKDGVTNIHSIIQDMDQDRADVVGAVESLSDIAEGNAATTEETLASTELVASTIKNISDMATQLASIVKIMDENIANFVITK